MRLWMGIGLGLVALLLVAAVLQGFNQLIWQLSYWLPGWLVAPMVLLLLAALALGLAQLVLPWWRSGGNGRPRRSSPAPQPPASSRREAASRHLEAIDQTLDRVRDQVEREALRQERQRLQAELERGDLEIAVFGSGSTGKTSLIRALLNELVGSVAAAMGSTERSARYRLRLEGLPRALLLVVDGDLRAAEQEVFDTLASLGKRLLLVLNKCDLRGEREEERLLALLRQRGAGRIAPEDVIAASAAPQSVPRPGGRPLQPPAEVQGLLRRMAAVLRADGEELIADNLLLQSRQLGEASQQLLDRQRGRDAETIVERYMWIGAGVLLVNPLPGVDLLGTAAVNAQMVIEIGRLYGVSLSREAAQDLALSVGRTLAGLGLIKGGIGLISGALSLNLPALLLSRAVQALTAAWLTRVAGRSFITYFRQDQDWGDGGVREVLQKQYELNKREGALHRFLEVALSRVVEPWQRRQERRLPPQAQQRGPGPRGEEAARGPGDQAR